MAKKKQECCQEKFKTMIGGQALIEGIMMRGPEKDAIVVRTKDGLKLDVKPRKIRPKGSFTTWPLIRGAVGFFDSQVAGVKALMRSADLSLVSGSLFSAGMSPSRLLSSHAISLPIHTIGWGIPWGSPTIKSSTNPAAKAIICS